MNLIPTWKQNLEIAGKYTWCTFIQTLLNNTVVYQNSYFSFLLVMTLDLKPASTLQEQLLDARNTSGTFPMESMLTPGPPVPRTPSPRAGTRRSRSASAPGVFRTSWGSWSRWRDPWPCTIGHGWPRPIWAGSSRRGAGWPSRAMTRRAWTPSLTCTGEFRK